MKTVMVFGTFDVLHKGHFKLFEEAKKHGDYLIVVVARDSTVEEVKKHKTMYDEQTRLTVVQKAPFVDKAVLGNKDDKYKIIEEHQPDIICLGYDQKAFTDKLEKELRKRKITAKIVRLKPYKEDVYKSTKIKAALQNKHV
ncbi:FAD synthase [Candidatus Woesearchaeota archaeon]|nr:FAD synthase [Candidatus Woesearchaeota archaeon]